ncbi:MAG: twin-arginine translocase TatA/TatE family subunit, partial [Alphaproteobacteria bacterium]|nr:twin-arginine translocase TatA/TatE family subunit [Alphaproteobacteria bacterium]
VVLVIILVVFGAGKLPNVMGDLGRGIRSFKEGLEGKEEGTKKLPPDEK